MAVTWAISGLTVWNGQYFMEQVLTANATSNILEAGKAGASSRGHLLSGSSGVSLREQPLSPQDAMVSSEAGRGEALPQQ
jgi:hypothetical protein